MKIKVVNKNKNGVTFKILDLPKQYGQPKDTATWEEFHKMFEPISGEKFLYKTTKEFDDVQKEKLDFFTKLFPHMLALRTSNSRSDAHGSLEGFSILASYQEEYQEKFGGAPIDFMREYRVFEENMLKSFMSSGIGVGEVHRDVYDLEDENPKKMEEVMTTDGTETYTLGEVFK